MSKSDQSVTHAKEIANSSVLPQSNPLSDSDMSFLLAQYTSLREEVLKRIELQHQLILGAVVAVGTILTIGIQAGGSPGSGLPQGPSVLLIYPLVALFFALAWSQNDARNREITQHLAKSEEILLSNPAMGWEHVRVSVRLGFLGSRKVFAARGIFIGSQLMTLIVFLFETQMLNLSTIDVISIVLNIAIIAATVLILRRPDKA